MNQRNPRFILADVRAKKIAKGLCYYCDKPFERGNKCQFKQSQLFTVEVWEKEEPGEEIDVEQEEEVEI